MAVSRMCGVKALLLLPMGKDRYFWL